MKKLIVLMFLTAFTGLAVSAEPERLFDVSNEAKLEYNQGVDFYKTGAYDRSMASFRRAIELDPNYIDAYYNLGSILEYLKQDEAALAVFKQIIVRKPDDYDAVFKAANLSARLGYTDNAKSYLSLIPPESNAYSRAQKLAYDLNTDMQTIKASQAVSQNSETSKFEQTNGIYNDIPSPTGVTTDSNGNVYVACFSDNMIYKITPDGRRIIYVKDSRINGPIAMVSDSFGNIYVSNYNANNVVKISPTGAISVQIANIQKPYGINVSNGMLFVSSQGSNSVLRYKL